jgi:hypothetical protein
MDRQYTIKESDVLKFINYAIDKGWSYKSYNNHYSLRNVDINDGGGIILAKNRNLTMSVKVNVKDYKRYPYMDTFRRYDVSNGILHNDDDDSEEYEGQYILDNTGGGYNEIQGGVYSEWHDRRIDPDEAVYSEALGDYLIRDSAVQVTRGDERGWYPDDGYDDIFFDEDYDEYIHVNDGVYSSIYKRMLYNDTAVLVVTKIFNDGDISPSENQYMYVDHDDITEIDTDLLWFEKISDKFNDWSDYSHISKKLLVVDYKGNYIPKLFAVTAYKIEPRDNAVDITGVKYLTKADSLGLGYDIIESENIIIDWFTYTETISEYTDILLEKLYKLIDRYSDVLSNKGQLQIQFKLTEEEEKEYRNKVYTNRTLCKDRLEHLQEETWN